MNDLVKIFRELDVYAKEEKDDYLKKRYIMASNLIKNVLSTKKNEFGVLKNIDLKTEEISKDEILQIIQSLETP